MTHRPSRRIRIRLRGIVQGVGFRPFVHNLALELDLAGYVLNSSAGLVAEVEGDPAAVDAFVKTLREDPPPLAWIQEMEVVKLEAAGDSTFAIRESVAETGEFALVSPDVATCDDCFRDFTAAANRRFGYAFTNCTNCGPRYTIIRDIPYDRPHTTMAAFHMCAACRAEYDDRRDRRFRQASKRRAAGWPRARSSPLKVWADSTWPAMPATPRPLAVCASASGAATSHSH